MRVLYPGGYDIVHHGHVNALNAAREIAGPTGHLIVGVNSDELMVSYKRTPTNDIMQRLHDVRRLGIADEVVRWNGPEHQAEQILAHAPDIYIAGTDWLSKDLAHQLNLPTLAWFDTHRISLMFLRRTTGISTTQLIQQRDQG